MNLFASWKAVSHNSATLHEREANALDLCVQTKWNEDELARFFSQSLDLLCIADFDGYFKRLNPAWITTLGWSLEELQASPFLDFVHPDDCESTLVRIDVLNKGSEVILFENRYRHKDGSYRWLRWNARSEPKLQRIYASARDVTSQKQLEREVLEIGDQEQERLGRELHDGLCQTLAGISALSSTLSKRLTLCSESAASADAREISQLLNEAIGEARNLSRGLCPLGLSGVGLDAALETLAHNIQHRFDIDCTLEVNGPFCRLSLEVETHLYRIAQEAVNNAVAHGLTKRIKISLSVKDGEGLLRIRDYGVGMPEKPSDSAGIGLHTMLYRARLIDGSLKVRQRKQRGMEVICAFPLNKILEPHKDLDYARNDP